jgi:hypothetical protein
MTLINKNGGSEQGIEEWDLEDVRRAHFKNVAAPLLTAYQNTKSQNVQEERIAINLW